MEGPHEAFLNSMFTHLHVRSWFSFLAGGSSPEDYVNRAYEMGMKSLALTDVNGVYGVVRFQKVCRDAGIRPVFGAEVSVGSRDEQEIGDNGWSVVEGRESKVDLSSSTHDPRPSNHHPLPTTDHPPAAAPILLLAASPTGYSNLCRILTSAHLRDGDEPHAFLDEVYEHREDLFCLTGAYGSRLWSLLDESRLEAARQWVETLGQIFGDRLSIEVAHHLLPGDKRRLQRLRALSDRTGIPMAATGDVRYAVADHYKRYDLMTCIRHGVTVFEAHPDRPRNAEAYLKEEEMMRKLIPWPEAFDRTEEIADACHVDLLPGFITPPAARVTTGETCREHLIRLCREALDVKYGKREALSEEFRDAERPDEKGDNGGQLQTLGREAITHHPQPSTTGPQPSTTGPQPSTTGPQPPTTGPRPSTTGPRPSTTGPRPSTEAPSSDKPRRSNSPRSRAEAQLATELNVILDLHLEEFFLVVHEIVEEARRRGIRCAGRGSAANSIVAYLLGITGVDPIEHRLLFERFLHGGRKGTPDIDVDFDSERREEVIAWMEERFGIEQTAMTATLVTYRLRSAVRDVAKALGWSMDEVNEMSKAVPPSRAHYARDHRVQLEQVVPSSPLLDTLLGMVESLADCPRHLGLHSGGMVLSRVPLHNFTPIQVSANGVKMVQFDKYDIEALGLVKLDVLGLRMLASVSEAVELIQRHEDPDFRLDDIPFDDIPTFNMIRASETLGTFQIESQGQLHLLAQHQPETFDDLITEIALFRPGPLQGGMVHPFVRRRRGEEPIQYDHPDLEPILKETYGIILFQEQVLEVAHRFAGMSLSEADDFRSLMSRFRDPGEMEQMRVKFVRGAMRRGVDEASANTVFDRVSKFVGYGFCRSHAAAFAKTVYESCYLKKHYPAAFMAAVMEHRPGMYNLMTLQEEARRFGVSTLPPDINKSGVRYDVEGEGAIRKPLTAVKELSEDDAKRIVWERLQDGLFTSIEDFYRRVPLEEDALRSLARSSAFDALVSRGPSAAAESRARSGSNSRRALWEVGLLLRSPVPRGQRSNRELFEVKAFSEDDIPDLPELTEATRLSWDYETHGSGRAHPMTLMRRTLSELEIRPIETCYRIGRYFTVRKHPAVWKNPSVTVAGLSVLRQRPPTANGVLFVTLEDETGFVQCVVRPTVLEHLDHVLRQSALIVRGELHIQGNWRGLVVTNAWPLNGIFGGYEGHPCHDAGRDRMVVRGVARGAEVREGDVGGGDVRDGDVRDGDVQDGDVRRGNVRKRVNGSISVN